jgi:HTH-type transcriptional repressor of NAD biosynthesis genes
MKRGIVAGRFMPLHKGHVALIRFAAAHCDELVISVFSTATDPIPGELRLAWVREEFMRYVKIKVIRVDVPGSSNKTWTSVISDQLGPFNYVFGSGNRDEAMAEMLEASYISFDPGRNENPISGKDILQHPFQYWDFIADPARSHFVKRICFYGPESTGKSTMAQRMAERYQTEFVPEVAKEFISSNQFSTNDIIRIAHAQTVRIQQKTSIANKILFCDTDLITTAIYSDIYLHSIPPVVKSLELQIRYDQYFLFDIDVPWVPDGLRDLGDKRQEVFLRFKNELEQREIPYILVTGSHAQREQQIVRFVDDLLVNG